MKRKITVYIQSLQPEYSSLDSFVGELLRLKAELSDNYSELHFGKKYDCSCYHNCGCEKTLFLVGSRLETDEEYTKRLAKEEAEALARDKEEKELLKKLRKKYKDDHN